MVRVGLMKKDGYVIFRKINERQYNYWIMNPLPEKYRVPDPRY